MRLDITCTALTSVFIIMLTRLYQVEPTRYYPVNKLALALVLHTITFQLVRLDEMKPLTASTLDVINSYSTQHTV